jgi:hypothetical protein
MSHNYHRSTLLAVLLAVTAFAVSVRPAHAQIPPPPTPPVVVSIFPPDGCYILAGNCDVQGVLATQVKITSGGNTVSCSGPLPEPAPHARPKTAHCDTNNNPLGPGAECQVLGVAGDATTTNWSETITGAGPFTLKCKFP